MIIQEKNAYHDSVGFNSSFEAIDEQLYFPKITSPEDIPILEVSDEQSFRDSYLSEGVYKIEEL